MLINVSNYQPEPLNILKEKGQPYFYQSSFPTIVLEWIPAILKRNFPQFEEECKKLGLLDYIKSNTINLCDNIDNMVNDTLDSQSYIQETITDRYIATVRFPVFGTVKIYEIGSVAPIGEFGLPILDTYYYGKKDDKNYPIVINRDYSIDLFKGNVTYKTNL